MATAVQQTTKTAETDALGELQRYLVDDDDAHFKQLRQRERAAVVVQKHSAALAGENAAARYRKLALCCQLVTDAEYRVLCLIVEKADANLKNSFASPAWLQRHLGGCCRRGPPRKGGAANERRTVGAIYKLVASLKRKGFLRWHRGRGWQLRLPEGVLAAGAGEWNGPTDWSKRTPKRTYRREATCTRTR